MLSLCLVISKYLNSPKYIISTKLNLKLDRSKLNICSQVNSKLFSRNSEVFEILDYYRFFFLGKSNYFIVD